MILTTDGADITDKNYRVLSVPSVKSVVCSLDFATAEPE
jgi:hypothetical protein